MFHAIEHLMESGVRFVTVWGFSTDNWKRQEDEISSLFKLVDIWIRKNADWAQAHKIKLRYIGRLQELPDNLQEVIQKAVTLTENNDRLVLNLAFNYSGRTEIIDAVNKLIAEHRQIKLTKIALVITCIPMVRRMSTWSSGPQGNTVSLTSCCGRLLTVNSTSLPFIGRISILKNWIKPLPPTANGKEDWAETCEYPKRIPDVVLY